MFKYSEKEFDQIKEKVKSDTINFGLVEAFCFTWDWEENKVVYLSVPDYAQQLQQIYEYKFVRRREIFSNQTLEIENETYYIRLESFGHSKKSKIILGPNKLAAAFDKLMYDYVYIFLETKEKANKHFYECIKDLCHQQIYVQALNVFESAKKLGLELPKDSKITYQSIKNDLEKYKKEKKENNKEFEKKKNECYQKHLEEAEQKRQKYLKNQNLTQNLKKQNGKDYSPNKIIRKTITKPQEIQKQTNKLKGGIKGSKNQKAVNKKADNARAINNIKQFTRQQNKLQKQNNQKKNEKKSDQNPKNNQKKNKNKK
ncbi:hypothetical protein PPERSA_12782 [Pseudocohnilembus persalinus]|uniref:Uncharacterized protein n=1 Tax=Pseudocohnilembus persalinus TaxID=266149 RepID=A0A0V0QTN4_PSEPJ|nr:hypothetical protein PPERSA_12782 [Pseudocohnilembus persalinus]|eukprot:KRX05604.1 hypothetical protein PPERSA_12782 [Pseudocohnilembus persalinus]